MNKNLVKWSIAALSLILLTMVPQQVSAHGAEDHHATGEPSHHMQVMVALKESIPADYRIMQRTPIPPDEQSLARGKELFDQQCAVCHGEQGRGDGVAAHNLKTPPADFLNLEHSAIYGPGEKYWIIGHGSDETGMPAFPQIALIDRWHLVNFIYHLQEKADAAPEGGHGHGSHE